MDSKWEQNNYFQVKSKGYLQAVQAEHNIYIFPLVYSYAHNLFLHNCVLVPTSISFIFKILYNNTNKILKTQKKSYVTLSQICKQQNIKNCQEQVCGLVPRKFQSDWISEIKYSRTQSLGFNTQSFVVFHCSSGSKLLNVLLSFPSQTPFSILTALGTQQ